MSAYSWTKLGRIFDPTTSGVGDWMREFAQTPSIIVFDDIVRIYFCTRAHPINGQYISNLASLDVKRSNLFEIVDISKKPLLDLGGLGAFDEFGIYPASAINHNGDFRVYYGGNSRCEGVPFNACIGVALSKDKGKTFQRIGPGPVLSFSPDEPFTLGSPKIRVFNGKWYLWYASGKKWVVDPNGVKVPVYTIRMAISDDGINWRKHGKELLPTVLEENECQASADVIFANGKYHMFFSYRYHSGYKDGLDRGYRMGYAVSNDLLNWERLDEKVGFYKSAEGWDSESVSYGHVFILDGKTYMLYQGNNMAKVGFGLAQLNGTLQ